MLIVTLKNERADERSISVSGANPLKQTLVDERADQRADQRFRSSVRSSARSLTSVPIGVRSAVPLIASLIGALIDERLFQRGGAGHAHAWLIATLTNEPCDKPVQPPRLVKVCAVLIRSHKP